MPPKPKKFGVYGARLFSKLPPNGNFEEGRPASVGSAEEGAVLNDGAAESSSCPDIGLKTAIDGEEIYKAELDIIKMTAKEFVARLELRQIKLLAINTLYLINAANQEDIQDFSKKDVQNVVNFYPFFIKNVLDECKEKGIKIAFVNAQFEIDEFGRSSGKKNFCLEVLDACEYKAKGDLYQKPIVGIFEYFHYNKQNLSDEAAAKNWQKTNLNELRAIALALENAGLRGEQVFIWSFALSEKQQINKSKNIMPSLDFEPSINFSYNLKGDGPINFGDHFGCASRLKSLVCEAKVAEIVYPKSEALPNSASNLRNALNKELPKYSCA